MVSTRAVAGAGSIAIALSALACEPERIRPPPENLSREGTCSFVEDDITISYTTHDGRTPGCEEYVLGSPPSIVLEGVFTTTVDGEWAIDSCRLSEGCDPMVSTIRVTTATPPPGVPDGAFVRATIQESIVGGLCRGHHVLIENLPEWDGPNPVSTGTHAWVAVGEGIDSTGFPSPFESRVVKACDEDSYIGHLVVWLGDTQPLQVGQAVTRAWTIESGEQTGAHLVRNVRCLNPIGEGSPCDFWIARADN